MHGLPRVWLVVVVVCVGCGAGQEQAVHSPAEAHDDEPAPTAQTAPSTTEPEPDQGSRCRSNLARFGEAAVERELDDCVEAFTTGWELEACEERGLGEDYLGCVDSCMRSVDLGGEYVPGDVMGNCRGPCHQVTCTEDAP